MAPRVGASNATEFLQFFGTKSGRVGGATAACTASIPADVWQAHIGWKFDALHRYIERSSASK